MILEMDVGIPGISEESSLFQFQMPSNVHVLKTVKTGDIFIPQDVLCSALQSCRSFQDFIRQHKPAAAIVLMNCQSTYQLPNPPLWPLLYVPCPNRKSSFRIACLETLPGLLGRLFQNWSVSFGEGSGKYFKIYCNMQLSQNPLWGFRRV